MFIVHLDIFIVFITLTIVLVRGIADDSFTLHTFGQFGLWTHSRLSIEEHGVMGAISCRSAGCGVAITLSSSSSLEITEY
jgi:hypothetical protein